MTIPNCESIFDEVEAVFAKIEADHYLMDAAASHGQSTSCKPSITTISLSKVRPNATSANSHDCPANKGSDRHGAATCPVYTTHTLIPHAHTSTLTTALQSDGHTDVEPQALTPTLIEGTGKPARSPAQAEAPSPERLQALVRMGRAHGHGKSPRVKTSTQPVVLPSRWRLLTKQQQHIVAARLPDAHAFTLNLSPEIEATARAHGDPIAYIAKRVNCYLATSELAGVPYSMVIESSPAGRLHVHGVILMTDTDPAGLKSALSRAGGKISGHAGSRQVKLVPIDNPEGWASYTAKDRRDTAKVLPGKRLVSLSRTMTQLARATHEAPLPAPKRRKKSS